MSDIVPFTDNFNDLSNDSGYQFEFICERCGNGYRSPFQRDKMEAGKGLLKMFGAFGGGAAGRLGNVAEYLDRATGSPQKDKALAAAVEAVSPNFRQCRGCGNWVCQEVCWNDDVGQCLNCSPSVADEISKAQAKAQVEQIKEKVTEIDYTRDLDLTTRVRVQCPSCHATVDGGKFCGECGAALTSTAECSNCGTALNGAKFCPECGQKA